jgi:hypothetical protein
MRISALQKNTTSSRSPAWPGGLWRELLTMYEVLGVAQNVVGATAGKRRSCCGLGCGQGLKHCESRNAVNGPGRRHRPRVRFLGIRGRTVPRPQSNTSSLHCLLVFFAFAIN